MVLTSISQPTSLHDDSVFCEELFFASNSSSPMEDGKLDYFELLEDDFDCGALEIEAGEPPDREQFYQLPGEATSMHQPALTPLQLSDAMHSSMSAAKHTSLTRRQSIGRQGKITDRNCFRPDEPSSRIVAWQQQHEARENLVVDICHKECGFSPRLEDHFREEEDIDQVWCNEYFQTVPSAPTPDQEVPAEITVPTNPHYSVDSNHRGSLNGHWGAKHAFGHSVNDNIPFEKTRVSDGQSNMRVHDGSIRVLFPDQTAGQFSDHLTGGKLNGWLETFQSPAALNVDVRSDSPLTGKGIYEQSCSSANSTQQDSCPVGFVCREQRDGIVQHSKSQLENWTGIPTTNAAFQRNESNTQVDYKQQCLQQQLLTAICCPIFCSPVPVVVNQKTAPTGQDLTSVPEDYDILLGRGNRSNRHPGNVRFRSLILQHRKSYQSASIQEQKTFVSYLLVGLSKAPFLYEGNMVAPRFLSFNKALKGWEEVDNEVARRKIAHVLRSSTHRSPSK